MLRALASVVYDSGRTAKVKICIVGSPAIERGEFAAEARNVHYGVREHGMLSINNGLALSGFVPFGSTFLMTSQKHSTVSPPVVPLYSSSANSSDVTGGSYAAYNQNYSIGAGTLAAINCQARSKRYTARLPSTFGNTETFLPSRITMRSSIRTP